MKTKFIKLSQACLNRNATRHLNWVDTIWKDKMIVFATRKPTSVTCTLELVVGTIVEMNELVIAWRKFFRWATGTTRRYIFVK